MRWANISGLLFQHRIDIGQCFFQPIEPQQNLGAVHQGERLIRFQLEYFVKLIEGLLIVAHDAVDFPAVLVSSGRIGSQLGDAVEALQSLLVVARLTKNLALQNQGIRIVRGIVQNRSDRR